MRTDDVHEHVPERFLDAIGVTVAIARHLRLAVVRRMARDYVDQFISAEPRTNRIATERNWGDGKEGAQSSGLRSGADRRK